MFICAIYLSFGLGKGPHTIAVAFWYGLHVYWSVFSFIFFVMGFCVLFGGLLFGSSLLKMKA